MIWAQWVIVGVGVIGAIALVLLGLRLWRRVKGFAALLGRASTTLAEATASLEAAQSARPSRSSGKARLAAYTPDTPNGRTF